MRLPSGDSYRRAWHVLIGAAWALASAAVMHGQALIFPNFTSTSGLTLTSSSTTTTTDGKVLRLVTDNSAGSDIGAAFGTTQRSVTNGFSTAFDFRLTNPG